MEMYKYDIDLSRHSNKDMILKQIGNLAYVGPDYDPSTGLYTFFLEKCYDVNELGLSKSCIVSQSG